MIQKYKSKYESGKMNDFQLIRITKNYGRHTDVYVDFENQILKNTNWKAIPAANKYLQVLFNKWVLPKLKLRQFNFDLPIFHAKRFLFAVISGTEYSKIFLRYSFKAKQKAVYMFDPWPSVNNLNENAFRSFKINIAFISAKQAVHYFNSLNIDGFMAHWIPEGVYSEGYHYCNYVDKKIDVIQYGRQWGQLHNKINSYCKKNNIIYEFPTDNDFSKSQFTTRNRLTKALAGSKITVCVPRNITHPEDVGNLSTLTTRYFECMSSKCLIWGTAPAELIELFGYNPVIEIDIEKADEQLLYLLNNYESYIPLIEKNYQTVLHNHQWKNRIDDMMKILSSSNCV